MDSRPKFRLDLDVFHQEEPGGKRRVVLKDPVSAKYYRLSHYEFEFLKHFNGKLTVEEVVERLKASGRYYSREDAKLIANRADQLGLLLGGGFGTSKSQKLAKERHELMQKSARLSGVYFWFIPLFNPDAFLERTLWLFKLFANRWTRALVVLAAPGAAYFVIVGLQRIQTEYLFFFNLNNLLFLWFTIAITKFIHEFSHAYVAKSFGLHVPQMGLALLIFFPCLYCNTTDAWQLANRKQRVAIAAAGVGAEAVLAVACTYIWYFTKPGLINSLAFYMMAISFISTVLFNGNPLMKFDGYYILSDFLEVPNLYAKSFRYVRYLFMNRVMGVSSIEDTTVTNRERIIFTTYGVSSFVWRFFLYIGIAAGVYYRFDKVLGILLGALAVGLFIFRPFFRGMASLCRQRGALSPRPIGVLVFLGIVAIVGTILFVPLASRSVYPCYLGSVEIQKLTVPLLTLVKEVYIKEGSVVTKGTLLYRLDSSQLELLLHKKQTERDIKRAEFQTLLLDRDQIAKAREKEVELRQAEMEIAGIQEDLRIANSSIIAPFDGVVTTLDYRMQPGFQPGEGVIVGELQSPSDLVIRALVPATDIHKVSEGQDAEVFFPVTDGPILRTRIRSIKAYSERDLRNSPFSSRFGGELATEVKGEAHKDAPLEAQYECSAEFPHTDLAVPLGMTGRLAVASPPRSIMGRLSDRLIAAFNRESLF